MKISLGAKPLVFPTPVWIVGSYDEEGKPNVMAAAWGGICCSRPPCIAVSLRKATYSYGNIVSRKAFTVGVPSEEHVREADYIGIVSGRDTDKFASARLTPVRSALVDAPYVGEFPLVLECRLLHAIELGLHTQFVGEILDVKAEESARDANGHLDIEKVRPILFEPEVRTYHGVGRLLGNAYSIGKDLTGANPR
jgi:flavin reductase (DIM6/NTAB) family NADH-FMN oxidoreductase RutF